MSDTNIGLNVNLNKNVDIQVNSSRRNLQVQIDGVANNNVQLQVQVQPRTRNIQVAAQTLSQDIEVKMSSFIIDAYSPTAKVEQISEGLILITITDKNGTTQAEIPVLSMSTVDNIIQHWFDTHDIPIVQGIENEIRDQVIYQKLKQIIQGAIDIYIEQGTNGSININGQNYQVYTLPESTLDREDILILDCGNSETEYR